MNNYNALLENMMNAMLAGDATKAPALYRAKDGFSAEEQLLVYTQGYRIRLQKIIRHTYPALHYYLGNDPFKISVRKYFTNSPSHYYNIDKYAIAFGRYVADTQNDGFAGELALLESVTREAHFLPESAALDPAWLTKRSADAITNTHFQLRAASYLLALTYPVSLYLKDFYTDKKPAKPDKKDTWLIVLRDYDCVRRIPLEEAEYVLLGLIADGHTLGTALASEQFAAYANDKHVAKNFQQWFSRWVNEGFFKTPE